MSTEAIGLIVVFMAGILVDHFLFNKLAGMVTGEVAEMKAQLAAAMARLPIHALPVAPPPPPPPVAPGVKAAPVSPTVVLPNLGP